MARTASSPAVMSTPAALYDSPTTVRLLGQQGRLVHEPLELPRRHRIVLEPVLAQVHRHLDGIVPGETRRAESCADRSGRLLQPIEIEVGEPVRTDVVADLTDRHLGGDQLASIAGV